MSPGSASLLLLVLFCAGTAVIGSVLPLPVSKLGECPAAVDDPPCNFSFEPLCKLDQDCKGTLKCCYYQCRYQCVLPVAAKKDFCPYFDCKLCVRSLPRACRSAEQCPGTDLCCYYKCQYQCVPAVAVTPLPASKLGECPADVDYPPCKIPLEILCKLDQECKKPLKCCFYKCGNQCVLPLAAKKGSCPYFDYKLCVPSLMNQCRCDEQCPGTELCCYYKCQYQCMPAV